jgi:hypothetical protein
MQRIRLINIMLLALTCIGCTKFLDKNPENKVSIDDLFSDMEGAKAALAGVYIDLWSTDYYNGLSRNSRRKYKACQ